MEHHIWVSGWRGTALTYLQVSIESLTHVPLLLFFTVKSSASDSVALNLVFTPKVTSF